MTTNKAFEQMIFTRAIYHTLGLSQTNVGYIRLEFKAGRFPLDRKIELLKRAGYKMKQDIEWTKP